MDVMQSKPNRAWSNLFRAKPLNYGHYQKDTGLTRSFGTFSLMMLGIGATVGTGIFFVLAEAVPKAGPAVLISFLLAGLAAGLAALCYAEIASAIPVSGSSYSYAYHAFGELPAVLVGACVLLEYGVAAGAVAVGWSGYFNELLQSVIGIRLPHALSTSPISVNGEIAGIVNLPAMVLVFMCMLLLVRGASESVKVNTVMVIIKLSVLVMFCAISFTAFKTDSFANFWGAGGVGISAAASTIFFSFIGLDAISTAGEEVRNPQKSIPRAILGAMAIVIAVYILIALAALGAQPIAEFSSAEQAEAGLSVILRNVTGSHVWSTVLAAGAVISIFSVTLVTIYGQTRVIYAMSRDGMLPKRLSKVNKKTNAPVFNTVCVSIVVALIAGFIPADYLWNTVSIGTLVAFSVVSLGVIALRKAHPNLHRPFRLPGYPVTPILSFLTCAYILYGLPASTWIVFGVWVSIVVAYYFCWGRSAVNEISENSKNTEFGLNNDV